MGPLLLEASANDEIRDGARNTYNRYFNTVIKLLRGSKAHNDAPWKAAFRALSFPKSKWTCLGYGAGSVAGSGSGDAMTDQMIQPGNEIVDLE